MQLWIDVCDRDERNTRVVGSKTLEAAPGYHAN
jgi:hypothetical protein